MICLTLLILWSPAQAQTYVWANSLKGRGTSTIENLEPGMSLANDIVLDSQENLIITGYSTDTVDFDPGAEELLLITQDQNPYLAKYDPDGNVLWAHVFPSAWNAYGHSVTVDKDDNVIFTGNGLEPIDFDPGPGEAILGNESTNGGFAFFAKYDPEGNLLFAKEFHGDYGAIPNRVRCDTDGSILIAGRFYGFLDIDPNDGELILDGTDGGGFWAKFDGDGNLIYGNAITGISNLGNITDLSICQNGDFLISGYFGNAVDFDPGLPEWIMTAESAADRFFARYTPDGIFVWAKRLNLNSYGCCGNTENIVIRENGQGDILIAGNFKQTADFDPGAGLSYIFSGLSTSAYFAKFDADGNYIWAKGLIGGFCPIYDMEIDCRDNIYLNGSIGFADFDPSDAYFPFQSNLSSASTHFLASYDADGNFLQVKQIGGSSSGRLSLQ